MILFYMRHRCWGGIWNNEWSLTTGRFGVRSTARSQYEGFVFLFIQQFVKIFLSDLALWNKDTNFDQKLLSRQSPDMKQYKTQVSSIHVCLLYHPCKNSCPLWHQLESFVIYFTSKKHLHLLQMWSLQWISGEVKQFTFVSRACLLILAFHTSIF